MTGAHDENPTGALNLSDLPTEVSRVLREAFGDRVVTGLSLLRGGLSGAMLLKMTVEGRSYVLRRSDLTGPDGAGRVARGLSCLSIAAARGVAPPLHHVDVSAGVSIMEHLEVQPFWRSPSALADRIVRVGRTLRRLHDGPAFPPGRGALGYSRLIQPALRARGQELPQALVHTIEQLGGLTARFQAEAPCHNDLNPGNLLETADAVFFIDWDTAGQGDPFFDLAQLGVFTFPAHEAREALRTAYLGRDATADELARAAVTHVLALGVYAASFIHLWSERGGDPYSLPAPVPIPQLLATLGAAAGYIPFDLVGASLFAEMQREQKTDQVAEATRRLCDGGG